MKTSGPEAVRHFVEYMHKSALTTNEQYRRNLPLIGTQDVGDAVIGTATDPNTGAITQTSVIEKGPTPAEQNTFVDTIGEDGTPMKVRNKDIPGMGVPERGVDPSTDVDLSVGPAGKTDMESITPVSSGPGIKTGLSLAETEQIKSDATNQQAYSKSLTEGVADASKTLQMVKVAKESLKTFTPSPNVEWFSGLASMAEGLGRTELADSISGGDYSAARTFMKNSIPLALSQVRQMSGQANRDLSQGEFERFIKSTPNWSDSKETVTQMLGFIEGFAKKRIQEQQAYSKWKELKRPPELFQAAWERKLAKDGYFVKDRDPSEYGE